MPQKPKVERLFNAFDRDIKRLWEVANAASHSLGIVRPVATATRFPNLRSAAPKLMSAAEVLDSAKHMHENLLWEWSLIIAITLFDSWLQDTVAAVHARFPAVKPAKDYKPDRPHFNIQFFDEDLSRIGFNFSGTRKLQIKSKVHNIADDLFAFLGWKEARNCLVHGNKKATQQCAAYGRFADGKRVALKSEHAREALRDVVAFADSIQKQLRRRIKVLKKPMLRTTTKSVKNG